MKSSQINSIRNKGLLQTTKPLSFKPHNFQWNVGLIYIHQNFPFALQSRVNPHAGFEVLPLTLQSEIKQHQIISLIKGNC